MLKKWYRGKDSNRLFTTGLAVVCLILVTGYGIKAGITLTHLDRSGDEGYFLKELARYQTDGMWKSFAAGTSHLHVLMVGALAAVTGSPLLAGRLLSILMLPLSLWLGWLILKRAGLSRPVLLAAVATLGYIVVFCQTGKMFYRFLNDPLMNLLLLLTLFLTQLFNEKGKTGLLVAAAIAAGMALWVRSFAILPLAGLLGYFLARMILTQSKGRTLVQLALFAAVSSGTALVVQIPSLAEHGRLAFESKEGDGKWAERNWLTRLERRNNGGVFSYQRVSWDEVEQYKEIHGERSMPRTLSEVARRDPKFLADNIVSNLFIRVSFVMLISMGLFFLLFLDLIRKPGWLLRPSQLAINRLYFLVAASLTLGLSLIVINYIEHRWLFTAVFCVLVLGAVQLDRKHWSKRKNFIAGSQLALVALMSAGELLMVLLKGF